MRGTSRRGFTLIEAVVVVLALSISLPTTLIWLGEANQRRADSVNTTRATALGTLVMEQVLADVSSKSAGLGFSALANSATYLNTATTGLVARLSSITSLYTGMGINYGVTIGGLVDKSGAATGVTSQDLFRSVTVTVTFTGSDGSARTLSLQSMVTSL
ncbi:MAG TPA: type II secretion system protein [Phycisphaerales bacterium]|nr:type II secretion system protein [Phycisphaerales bacterium]